MKYFFLVVGGFAVRESFFYGDPWVHSDVESWPQLPGRADRWPWKNISGFWLEVCR